MKWDTAIDAFLEHMKGAGRINSPGSERAYRDTLRRHAEDCERDDPRESTYEDALRTLARWPHPNTKRNWHAIISSFSGWMVRHRHRKDNPADQIERAKKRKPEAPRLRQDEALAMLAACETARERRGWFAELPRGPAWRAMRMRCGAHSRT